MEKSTHIGARILLAALLAFSLLGITSLEAVTKAFAEDEPVASEAAGQSAQDAEMNADVSVTSQHDLEKEAILSPDEDAFEAQSTANEETGSNQSEALSLKTPEKRYVYENVYGVFANEYTVASNESDGWGALVSASKGDAINPDLEIDPWMSDCIVNRSIDYAPFRQNGKYGLLNVKSNSTAIKPLYDVASSLHYEYNEDGSSIPNGTRWGFMQFGDPDARGVYPNAKAVFTSGGKVVFSVALDDYVKDSQGYHGRIYCDHDSDTGKSSFWVYWSSLDSNGRIIYRYDRYVEGENGYELDASRTSGAVSYPTSGGCKVTFRDDGGRIVFTVTDAQGNVSPQKTIGTNNTSISSFRTISNLIEVSTSNGYNHQYFTLDGTLVQSLNDQSLTGFGDYVSYLRTDFETQKLVQVFLDTTDNCREAKTISVVQTSFPSSNSTSGTDPVFECLTEDGIIQRYDKDLNLTKGFEATPNLVKRVQEGFPYRWNVDDLGNDAWLVSESVWSSTSWNAVRVDGTSRVFKAGKAIPLGSLGFESSYVTECEVVGNDVFMIDDSGSNLIRIFRNGTDLEPWKQIDLAPFVPEGKTLHAVDVGTGYQHSVQFELGIASLALTLCDGSSYCESKTIYLDKNYKATDFTELRCVADAFYIAKKGDKWGFVNTSLSPLSEFVYDDVSQYYGDSPYSGKWLAQQDGKFRILDDKLNDVLGIELDSRPINIGEDYIQAKSNGIDLVFDGNCQQVDLRGYKPFNRSSESYGYDGLRHMNGVRILPGGVLVVYLQDAQGKVGAIDLQGNVVIPFEYDDYAEEVVTSRPSSDYIMLKDEAGWFFMPVADLQHAKPNDDCETLGHDYVETKHEPTCTTNGYTQYVCNRCGYAYRDEASTVPALGHNFVLTEAATQPTCTEVGKGARYTCSRCGETKQDANTPSLGGHVDYDWRTVAEPTCTEPGKQEHTCSRCGNHEESEIAPLGHSWSYPSWEWSGDYQTATASMSCERGCGEVQVIPGKVAHTDVENGVRHSAQFEMNGRRYQDGRLTLGWVDADGVSRNLVVKGEPVADGFYVWPQGLELPKGQDSALEINVDPVSEGGIFDALVSKVGSGWPAGTFDVRLNIDGSEMHDGFGSLTFAFPAGVESAGKRATVYHCHKNDRANISSHDLIVDKDGNVVLSGVVDLSTFALEILDDEAVATPEAPVPTTKPIGSTLANTGDGAGVVAGGLCVAAMLGTVLVVVACIRRKNAAM